MCSLFRPGVRGAAGTTAPPTAIRAPRADQTGRAAGSPPRPAIRRGRRSPTRPANPDLSRLFAPLSQENTNAPHRPWHRRMRLARHSTRERPRHRRRACLSRYPDHRRPGRGRRSHPARSILPALRRQWRPRPGSGSWPRLRIRQAGHQRPGFRRQRRHRHPAHRERKDTNRLARHRGHRKIPGFRQCATRVDRFSRCHPRIRPYRHSPHRRRRIRFYRANPVFRQRAG